MTGRRNDGVFKNLEKLSAGDQYTIEFGDGTVKKFKVKAKNSVPVKQSVGVIFSQDPKITSQLNLVTCSGSYDEKTHAYTERLIVISEQF